MLINLQLQMFLCISQSVALKLCNESVSKIKMNINSYTKILALLLIVLQVNGSCPIGSKQLDDQCSTYCYQVVKPLLQYVNTVTSMTQEYNELQYTIKLHAEKIINLNELIKSKDMKLAQQIKLTESYESQTRNQQKLIDQDKGQSELKHTLIESCERPSRIQQIHINECEMQLTDLRSEIKSKDNQIKDLQLQNVHIKELQKEITAGVGWIIIQRRMDGSVNFNRTWSEYKEGFGDSSGEFFIGLEKLHLLTQSQPHELYVCLMDFANETRYARYSNFAIGNELEFYELKELGTYSGNAGDSLKIHRTMMFSTADRYDHTSGTCAKKFSSGWWFEDCYYCNLNGRYAYFNEGDNVKSVEWRKWKHTPLKFVQMMIRPNSS